MTQYFNSKRKDLRQCKSEQISDCGLKLNDIKSLVGNPAGTNRRDSRNALFDKKVFVQNGKLHIHLTYLLTGHIPRAELGLHNIQTVYRRAGVSVALKPSSVKPDLRIHGANLTELMQGLKLCDCRASLYIGGWAPSPTHPKWSNALLLNPHLPKDAWELVDAHEFGHKLGLKHKVDGGIMDYPPKKGKDMRRVTTSDINRIISLYR